MVSSAEALGLYECDTMLWIFYEPVPFSVLWSDRAAHSAAARSHRRQTPAALRP